MIAASDLFDLKGKVAIITGASRGLGRCAARALSRAGADVVVTDVLDVAETMREIQSLRGRATGMRVDVTKQDDVQQMVQKTLQEHGKIDILVNNAGILLMAPAERMTEQDWDRVMAVNLKGQFLCAQEVGKLMIKQKSGKIVNVASSVAVVAFPQALAYNVSKAGVVAMTRTLALEWGKYNIQVNAICPGTFSTPMTASLLNDPSFAEWLDTKIPLARLGHARRHGEPEDLSGAVVYLASKASDYVTGHALVIDGGLTVGLL
jgi:NAD(P)-dependent dehydrogenase (short-subunit alcohol dehydrogenase family)